MNELTPPAIVNERDNGLTYLTLLCNLFEVDLASVPEEKRPEALQLFSGLYVFPSIDDGGARAQALDELDDLANEHFPIPEFEGIGDALMHGLQAGLAHSWGTTNPDVRSAYFNTRAQMIVYRNRWRNLTMGPPGDLVQGYRWRRLVTAFIEGVAGLVIAGGAYSTVEAAAARGVEGSINSGSMREGVRQGIRQGTQRLAAGGSGIVQAATNGRGLPALASRGGALGLFGLYVISYAYATLKDEETDIRNAVALRALEDPSLEPYLDEIDEGFFGAAASLVTDEWYE